MRISRASSHVGPLRVPRSGVKDVVFQPQTAIYSSSALAGDFGYPDCNSVGGGIERIVGEVGIAGRSLHLAVAEQLADHRQPFTDEQTATEKAVPEIVHAQVIHLRAVQNATP